MKYTIRVDGKYFVGETMKPVQGQSIAPIGFFQMVGGNTMCSYEYSDRFADASQMILYNAIGYLQGIYERTRYLTENERPKRIEISIIEESEVASHDK